MVTALFYPIEVNFYTDNVCASVTNYISTQMHHLTQTAVLEKTALGVLRCLLLSHHYHHLDLTGWNPAVGGRFHFKWTGKFFGKQYYRELYLPVDQTRVLQQYCDI